MTLLKAISTQWQQGQLAEIIELHLMNEAEIHPLFVGATSMATVANLIATIGYRERYIQQELPIPDTIMLTILSDCFRLLVAKQLAHDDLSQAETLIIQITKVWANKSLSPDLPLDELQHYQGLQRSLLKLAQQLDAVQKQRKQRHRNM